MKELLFYKLLLIIFSLIGLIVFIILFFIPAPYGRHVRKGWGPILSNRLAWAVMELPALIGFIVFYIISERREEIISMVFLILWLSHYAYRSLIYPFLLREDKCMPVSILLMGLFFNVLNSYLQGRWLFALSPKKQYSINWLTDTRFVIGVFIFFAGMIINRHSDFILRNLRKPGETGYKIPEGGMFKWISSPNYFGEIVEWIGWAIATWSLAGMVFAFWTSANLVPRAVTNHKWYKEKFPNYPSERKILIPYLF
jgi:protein-S-isoprenylcysteine O-methyltransferase Ste14